MRLQAERAATVIRVIGLVVGAIAAVVAMVGAFDTMFAAVAARAREIATLRAIGLAVLSVVVAILTETLLPALARRVLGGALAWLPFDDDAASTMAAGTVGKLGFELHVTAAALSQGRK